MGVGMGKNILIFSDGTGQAGGLRPDQRMSNVYKMYRASRVWPDNDIDPQHQVAFYDPGLGSEETGGSLVTRVRKILSSATGAGIGVNIVQCYEAIIKHYEPGDRIYLIGFSRGAYTVRCVAGVLRLCGVPTKLPDGAPMPRSGPRVTAVAREAVHKVYEHGAGRQRERFEPERLELARRFRARYHSADGDVANVAPYFIGVFDTVAALGATGLRWVLLNFAIMLAIAAPPAALAWLLAHFAAIPFWTTMLWCILLLVALAALRILPARLKFITNYPAKGRFSWHWTGWRFGDYDTHLDKNASFVRHALSIDEERADFNRVPWGKRNQDIPLPPAQGAEWFQQIWFAGNHSDIGGSYPEDESRLSDIALAWMVEQAESLPHRIWFDRSKLNMFPKADGMQHCERQSLLDAWPRWWPERLRFTWKRYVRIHASGAPYHPTVRERLALPAILDQGRQRPYRPAALLFDTALRTEFPDGWPNDGPDTKGQT
jgi:uncharacterized protein (DUF2235 family)